MIVLVLLAGLAALHLGPYSKAALWDHAHQKGLLGALLHSVQLGRSGQELVSVVSDSRFPFKAIYNAHCKRRMNRQRFEEILHSRIEYHPALIHPDCLARSALRLSLDNVHLMGISPLQVSGPAPRMHTGALDHALQDMRYSDIRPYATCDWIWAVAGSPRQTATKQPSFWTHIHPMCFGSPHNLPRARALLHILFSGMNLKACSLGRRFHDYLRWIVRVCLVGLRLRTWEDLPLQAYINSTWVDIQLEISRFLAANYWHGYSLSSDDTSILNLAWNLITSVKQCIFPSGHASEAFMGVAMPPFGELVAQIRSHSIPYVKIWLQSSEAHWELSVIALYMQVSPRPIPDLSMRLAAIFSHPARIWPIDLIYLAQQQLEDVTISQFCRGMLLMHYLAKAVPESPELQTYVLTWASTAKAVAEGTQGPSSAYALVLAVPLARRIQHVRETWLQRGHAKTSLKTIVSRLQASERRLPGGTTHDPPSQLIRAYWEHLRRTGRFALNKLAGQRQLTMEVTTRMKMLGLMCAMSVLYNVPIGSDIDREQLRLLLNASAAVSSIVSSNPDALPYYFPAGSRHSGRKHRQTPLAHEDCIRRLRACQKAFASTLALPGLLRWRELVAILLPSARPSRPIGGAQ